MLEIHDLSTYYGPIRARKQVNLRVTIRKGEAFAKSNRRTNAVGICQPNW